MGGVERRGVASGSSSLPAAGTFVIGVPVLLLTFDGAVRRVPAAVVHRLFFTVITLKNKIKRILRRYKTCT